MGLGNRDSPVERILHIATSVLIYVPLQISTVVKPSSAVTLEAQVGAPGQ